MKTLIAALVAAFGITSAHADTLVEIAQFAQSICGDIPEGHLTRTSIQGQVVAQAGVLAKIVSGNANVGASRTEEIVKGIPFDKLPNNIPTVSMCKSELAKILITRSSERVTQEADSGPHCAPNSLAEIGARWVLRGDEGARHTYDEARAGGASRFSALMIAQGHRQGAGARAAFTAWGEDCVDWYARQNGG